ncbi:MAG TPA: SecY-interacting protein Syd [Pseudomonadales bacterium]
MNVHDALTEFMAHTQLAYPELRAPFDREWRSPCEVGEPFTTDAGLLIAWQPVPRDPATIREDFAPIERALDTVVHPDIKAYYGAYWSAGLEAEAVDGHVSLLFLWNRDDVARLNENLLGHAFAGGARARRRSGRPLSLFFACTDPESELFLSVDNAAGTVLLEKPGARRPLREVAGSLAAFLQTLVPRPPVLHP